MYFTFLLLFLDPIRDRFVDTAAVAVRRNDLTGPSSRQPLLQVTTRSHGFGAAWAQKVLLSRPF